MISSCTAMNKKTEPKAFQAPTGAAEGLADGEKSSSARAEPANLHHMPPDTLCVSGKAGGNDSLLLARLVKNLSKKDWQDFCQSYPHTQWYAIEVHEDLENALRIADISDNGSQSAADSAMIVIALQSEMFIAQLKKELMRLSRSGGSLCLISAGIVEREKLSDRLGRKPVRQMERALYDSMCGLLESCDSLGSITTGKYIALLPGIGQLKARRIAHQLQSTFSENAHSFMAAEGRAAAQSSPLCAVGILNIVHDSRLRAGKLFSQASEALEKALLMGAPCINQVFSNEVWDEATLVHSNEKRFLFFGGEPA